jgi:hypothetical protein
LKMFRAGGMFWARMTTRRVVVHGGRHVGWRSWLLDGGWDDRPILWSRAGGDSYMTDDGVLH